MEKSEVAKEYRAKTELRKLAASSVERDVSALRSPSSANRRNEDEQLTKQVQHLFTEKAMLQRRLKELERENTHLHDELEMLYAQVDEQADEVDAAYERAMRDAADVVVEDFLAEQAELDARREAEVAAARAEADAVRERLGELEAVARREREVRVLGIEALVSKLVDGAIRNVIGGGGDGGNDGNDGNDNVRGHRRTDVEQNPPRTPDPSIQSPSMQSPSMQTPSMQTPSMQSPSIQTPSSALTPARERELHALQRRSEELQRHMERMRSERAGMELEVAALRRELFEKEEQTYADRESLAREVEQLLARQAEMSSNLARARREKEMLEEDNEVLYAKAEEEAERARAEAEAAALARTPTTSEPKAPSPPARSPDRGGDVDAPDTPPTAEKATPPPPEPEGDESRRTRRRTAEAWGSSSDEEEEEEEEEDGTHDGTRAPPATANATPAGYQSPAHWRVHSQVTSPDRVRVRAAAAAKKSIADGPDSELAAKLMRRLKRAGEENEAKALSEQVRTLQAEQAEMRRAMVEVEREKERMAAEVARLKEAASPAMTGADAFVNPLSPAMGLGSMGLGSPLVSPFGSDDGIMREREEALSRREMELERELEERVREATAATAREVARLREECAAKDARIAELLAAAEA